MSRRFRLAGELLGGAAVTAGAGYAATRILAGRLRKAPDPLARESFGELHGPARTIYADDGVALHVEETGDPAAPLTVIFLHGFCLSMDCWYYQRRDLADLGRLVFYDLRSHGRSQRGPKEHATIEQLGRDLATVIEVVAPDGPIVLVGHSMGGMTIMALADMRPELFGARIVGVALMSTAASQVVTTAFGLPKFAGRMFTLAGPLLVPALSARTALLERGRSLSADASFLVTRWFAFGGHVSPSLVEFVERMLDATPVDVMLEFLPTLADHDRRGALSALRDVEVLVLTGAGDTLVLPDHSEAIAREIPHAELVSLSDAGHLVILERPALVNLHLRALVGRVARGRRGAASA